MSDKQSVVIIVYRSIFQLRYVLQVMALYFFFWHDGDEMRCKRCIEGTSSETDIISLVMHRWVIIIIRIAMDLELFPVGLSGIEMRD